ncbi:MAG: ribokinase [Pseudomonadota bacterium]
MSNVVVVGSYVQDMAFNTEVFPSPGETRIGEFTTNPGGKGFNQAVACNRLDTQTTFIGAVGDDAFGKVASDFGAAEKINMALQVIPNQATAAAGIIVDKSAQNLIVVALGANTYLSQEHILEHQAVIQTADVLVCQAECNLESTTLALQIAKKANTTTILNTAPINEDMNESLISHADIITPNETEFVFLMKHLRNIEVPGDFWTQSDQEIHDFCCQAGTPLVVLTLGDKGCFVSHNPTLNLRLGQNESPYYRLAARKVKTVDTTGAGDAFNGALAAGLVKHPGN